MANDAQICFKDSQSTKILKMVMSSYEKMKNSVYE